jgi:DNA-binding NtrC family response regulator
MRTAAQFPSVEQDPPQASREASVATGEHRATVLVVEDEDRVRRSVARLLHRYGLHLLAAASGAEAFAMAAEHPGPIHLILTDLWLPDITGPALVNGILAARPETRVIYTSAFDRQLLTRDGTQERCAVIIQRPFTNPELLAAIGRALNIDFQ